MKYCHIMKPGTTSVNANQILKQNIIFAQIKTKLESVIDEVESCQNIFNSLDRDHSQHLVKSATAPDTDSTKNSQISHDKGSLDELSQLKISDLENRASNAKLLAQKAEKLIESIKSNKSKSNSNEKSKNPNDLNQIHLGKINKIKNYLNNESQLCQEFANKRRQDKDEENFFQKSFRALSRSLGKPMATGRSDKVNAILQNETITPSRDEVDQLMLKAQLDLAPPPPIDNEGRPRDGGNGGNNGGNGNAGEKIEFPEVPIPNPQIIAAQGIGRASARLEAGVKR